MDRDDIFDNKYVSVGYYLLMPILVGVVVGIIAGDVVTGFMYGVITGIVFAVGDWKNLP